ncbi:MAG: hypothetical protein M1831_002022 [Alyxoria varia]|nr:MAG: hypothetical protein M1831_002022 [Alyxoria varia]
MAGTQEPLAPVDANVKTTQVDGGTKNENTKDPFSPLSDANSKPAPSFTDESKQHGALHSRLKGQEKSGKQSGTYVSPSDNIMSPASAKLNAFKEKRFAKSAKPRALFARTTPLNSSQDIHDISSPDTEQREESK